MNFVMAECSKSRSALSGRVGLRVRLNSYLVILLLSIFISPLVKSETPVRDNPSNQDGGVVMSTQARADARTLEPGKPFERELKPGETHSYLLNVSST
jgi:hypothetical protein